MSDDKPTHFGYQQVPVEENAASCHMCAVFDSVASRYDMMKNLISLGIHRLWKRATIELAGRCGQRGNVPGGGHRRLGRSLSQDYRR
jgi:demethylmenaquinone methyltransferase/2-methoxy-6-polyprenyl-1,4-benzoquinol methylase